MKPKGQLQYFRSPVDGELHPYAVCATDINPEPKPLIVEVCPGAISDLPGSVALTEEMAAIASENGQSCVVLRPTGRGPGSLYQNYGEVDVLEAIEHVASHFPIDRRRITVTGSSMGGAATWYLISHYPDLFAAAAPFCGYCDYRLWEKPGGSTFHMREWEEPSWISRSAAFLVENLIHTPVWMVHGEWDRSIGGGVSVEHSRQMDRFMTKMGYPHRYTEVPKTDHVCALPDIWKKVILWLLQQKKTNSPDRVRLVSYHLRHNRSYWVTLDQLICYGERGEIDARLSKDCLAVSTRNIRTFSMGPIQNTDKIEVTIDSQKVRDIDLSVQTKFQQDKKGVWQKEPFDLIAEKHRGASGPISDLFHEGLILVPGTNGTEEENLFNKWVARDAVDYFRGRNGGIHRGGIMGENCVNLPIIEDVKLTNDQLMENNLLLYGNFSTNAVLAKFKKQLPLMFKGKTLSLSDKKYTADHIAVFAIFPHPNNPQRYIAVHGGVAPDAICWGSHLDMQLLPDYIVYAKDKVLDWGFWGNDWKSQNNHSIPSTRNHYPERLEEPLVHTKEKFEISLRSRTPRVARNGKKRSLLPF